jgi:hypothetical protein
MRTYTINKPEELEQFKDKYIYRIEGDLEVYCDLNIDGGLDVRGTLKSTRCIAANDYISADENIIVGKYIKCRGPISAGLHLWVGEYICADDIVTDGIVEAGTYIKTRLYIEDKDYIKAGEYIKAGWYVRTDGYIEADKFIKSDWYIQSGLYIKAGEYIEAGQGILAGSYITCNGYLKARGSIFAGCSPQKELSNEEKTITCSKLIGGKVECGILKETGLTKK